jgi:hypothetical protein
VFKLFSFGNDSFVSVSSEFSSKTDSEPSAKNISLVSHAVVVIVSHSLLTSPFTVAIKTNSSGLYGKFVFDLSYTKLLPLYSLIRLYGQTSAV